MKNGFKIISGFLSQSEVEKYRDAIGVLGLAPGHRNVMEHLPAVGELARSERLVGLVCSEIGSGPQIPFPVRSIIFDKTPESNWSVPWHQDIAIAVKERREVSGFGPWSMKEGVVHVQPTASVLEAMLTLRIHLDPCDETNGALLVLPGSHSCGKLDAQSIANWKENSSPVSCNVVAGDLLLMRPLLLHASPQSKQPRHRRVIHIEYASQTLPGGLEWEGTRS